MMALLVGMRGNLETADLEWRAELGEQRSKEQA